MRVITIGGLSFMLLILPLLSAAPASGTWSTTGSLSNGRYAVTAVALPSGKVLLAGGVDNAVNVLSTTELYDPATGTWAPSGNMNMARNMYLAVLLPNGKVLVAGGCTTSSCSAATPTAELYDPTTGQWSPTGSMAGIHYFSAATLLPNGKVLVEGGCSQGNCMSITASAELYDPGTGQWSRTGSMKAARDYHTATLLANGKVLAAGGYGGGAAAEVFDPATGKWSPGGTMLYPHTQHSATLLPNGKVLIAGGTIGYLPSAYCELYDPASNTWKATGSMGTSRVGHPAVLLRTGRVLVAGGGSYTRPKYYKVSGAELYDAAKGTWSATGSMSTGRYEHGVALLLNGQVLAAGGLSNSMTALSTAELYTP